MSRIINVDNYDEQIARNLWNYITNPAMHWYNSNNISVDECLHKNCPECHGNGIKQNGEICIHMISCPCPRCTLRC